MSGVWTMKHGPCKTLSHVRRMKHGPCKTQWCASCETLTKTIYSRILRFSEQWVRDTVLVAVIFTDHVTSVNVTLFNLFWLICVYSTLLAVLTILLTAFAGAWTSDGRGLIRVQGFMTSKKESGCVQRIPTSKFLGRSSFTDLGMTRMLR